MFHVDLKTNGMPPSIRQEIDLEAQDVIIMDSLSRHGLAPHFPDRRRLWAIHYGGDGRSLEAGLCGDEIPSWCAALHSAFSAILNAASQGPLRSSRTCRWHWTGPPHGPFRVCDHVLELMCPDRSGTARSRTRLRSLSGGVISRG